MTLGGVQANPTLAKAKGIGHVLGEGVDLVLAVWRRQRDVAQPIASGRRGKPGCGLWTYFRQEAVPARALPVGVILTLSASGSEMKHIPVSSQMRKMDLSVALTA